MAGTVIKGHTSGSILNTPFQYSGKIISYSIIDKGSSSTVIVAIVRAGDQVYINYITLGANQVSETSLTINVQQGDELLIVASAAVDYYFSLEGVTA